MLSELKKSELSGNLLFRILMNCDWASALRSHRLCAGIAGDDGDSRIPKRSIVARSLFTSVPSTDLYRLSDVQVVTGIMRQRTKSRDMVLLMTISDLIFILCFIHIYNGFNKRIGRFNTPDLDIPHKRPLFKIIRLLAVDDPCGSIAVLLVFVNAFFDSEVPDH
jgi:hypothetical protein